MRITSVRTDLVRWPITAVGAARGRTERAAIIVEITTDDGVQSVSRRLERVERKLR